MEEMEQLKQQAGLQREELEAEVQKTREDESFLRDHLSISVKATEMLGNAGGSSAHAEGKTVLIFTFRTTDVLKWSCWTEPKN